MKVEEIMNKKPACCTPAATLEDAARLMVDHNCGALPVVESEDSLSLVGMITDRDIVCRGVAQGKNPRETRVIECFSGTAVTVAPEDALEDCLRIMERNQVRRVPVVDGRGRCRGIVTQAQVARHASEQQAARLLKGVSRKSSSPSAVGQT